MGVKRGQHESQMAAVASASLVIGDDCLASWRASGTTPGCPRSGLWRCFSRFSHGGPLTGCAAEVEIRDRFGCWGDPTMRSRRQEG